MTWNRYYNFYGQVTKSEDDPTSSSRLASLIRYRLSGNSLNSTRGAVINPGGISDPMVLQTSFSTTALAAGHKIYQSSGNACGRYKGLQKALDVL